MKKTVSFILVLSLVVASFVFAAATDAAGLKDLAGTKYEDAVNELVNKGIVTGYPDGTFRPDSSINRAEACIIAVKLLGIPESGLDSATSNNFPDMAGYGWAERHINYAAENGIISGYTDGTFRPGGNVSYAEMASMLVRALGYKAEDLQGSWPANFMDKAAELGLLRGVYGKANEKAIRGDVALMSQKTLWELDGADDGVDEDEDNAGKVDNPLSDFSGRAYGILLSVSSVLNDEGKTVDEYEFLFGSKVLYLKTNGKVGRPDSDVIDIWHAEGTLTGLQMSKGVVTKIGSSDEDPGFAGIGSPSGFEDLTATDSALKWAKVKEYDNQVIVTTEKYGPAGKERDAFSVLDDASIFVAVVKNGIIESYKAGSFKDIKKDKFVRIFSVTGKNEGVGEIVIVSSIASAP